jgi:hypothetical protein
MPDTALALKAALASLGRPTSSEDEAELRRVIAVVEPILAGGGHDRRVPATGGPAAATLAGWRKITEAATSGPWNVETKHGRDIADEAWSEVRIKAPDGGDIASTYISHLLENYRSEEDEAFIVTARTAMPCLLAALEAADAALRRHMHPFTDHQGISLCGGCLRPSPCPDEAAITAALAGKDAPDVPA